MARLGVFDLDGTLIDSRLDLAESVNLLIEDRGGRPLPVEQITAMVGDGAAMLVTRALSVAGIPVDLDSALPRFLQIYDDRLLVHTVLYPGVREMLDAAGRRAALAILTNKPLHHTERILAGLGVASLFGVVLGGDSPLGRKPDPRGLRHIVEEAGVAADEALLVGDSAIDLRTARAAGVRICLVRYGFGFSSARAELTGGEAIADAPSDVIELL